MKIYVFGNPLVKEDSISLQLLPHLKKSFPQINFLVVDPNENFPSENEKSLIILDTVMGIKKPTLLEIKGFEEKKKNPTSQHDYDLLLHLLLLKKMKKIESAKIIGIPPNFKGRTLLVEHVNNLISTLLSENVQRRTYMGQRRG